ncbi:MAG TPA: hypothetical protein VJL57_01685 [Candidatus Paceibacterota bacterium]
MTKLLEKALEEVRKLPDDRQNMLAATLLSMTQEPADEVDEETWVAIQEGLEQARRGEFASDAEMEALWRKHGVL